jgi:hypothetical protein
MRWCDSSQYSWSFAFCSQHPVLATIAEALERIDARMRGEVGV